MPFIGSIIVKPYVASEDIYCVDIQNYAKKISYCVREPKISFMYLLYCVLGWSDIHFLRLSKLGTLLSVGYIF